jgi:hypothetical protein
MTTTDTPAIPRTPLERLRWAILDTWTITGRDLAHWVRQPARCSSPCCSRSCWC